MTLNKSQVDLNFQVFRKLLPEMLQTHAGKFAVMHDGNIIDYFDTFADAARFGADKYGAGKFSVQEVTSREISLGCHSYALHNPAA